MARNELIVVQGHDHPLLLRRELEAGDLSWIDGSGPDVRTEVPGAAMPESGQLGAKTRYRQTDAACQIAGLSDERMALKFEAPQWAVTPGQSAVLYRGEVCLGGGVIR